MRYPEDLIDSVVRACRKSPDAEVAKQFNLSTDTVGDWRRKFSTVRRLRTPGKKADFSLPRWQGLVLMLSGMSIKEAAARSGATVQMIHGAAFRYRERPDFKEAIDALVKRLPTL